MNILYTSYTDEWHEFWYIIRAGRFNDGVFPPDGRYTYTIRVEPTDGTDPWEETDEADIGPLPVLELLTPSDGSAVTPAPTFQWNRVEGAERYRVEIWPVTTGSWVYEGFTADLSHTVTGQGILVPGESYRWGPSGTAGIKDYRGIRSIPVNSLKGIRSFVK